LAVTESLNPNFLATYAVNKPTTFSAYSSKLVA